LGTGCSPCARCTGQGNDCVDPNGTNGKPTFRGRVRQSWVSEICNHFTDIAAWIRKSFKIFMQKLTFLETRPLLANFQKCVPKGFMATQIHVSCVNFVKFGWPEIGKVVHYLLDKKEQSFGSLSRPWFCTDCARNLIGPAPDNILGVPQISSKSVHFRWSYSRTREHCWNAP